MLCSSVALSNDKMGWYLLAGGSIYQADEYSYVNDGVGLRLGLGVRTSNRIGFEILLDNPPFSEQWWGVHMSVVGTYTHETRPQTSLIFKVGMTNIYIESEYRSTRFNERTDPMFSVGILFDRSKRFQYEVSLNTVGREYLTNSIQGQIRYKF